MQKTLRTTAFIELTEQFLQDNIFDSSHYIYTVKNNNSIRGLWTEAGLQHFKNMFMISQEEENIWIAHYFFVAECIGEAALAREVTRRHNLKYPNDKKEEKAVKSFLTSKWGDFQSKSKTELMLCFEHLVSLRHDLENKVDIGEKIFNKDVRYEDMVL
ncbi:MAG: hypothetical protein IE916_00565 [Epsilonproteobacteria bacterium]|nr:hypothetical protein [Campylobacterota bacterium]